MFGYHFYTDRKTSAHGTCPEQVSNLQSVPFLFLFIFFPRFKNRPRLYHLYLRLQSDSQTLRLLFPLRQSLFRPLSSLPNTFLNFSSLAKTHTHPKFMPQVHSFSSNFHFRDGHSQTQISFEQQEQASEDFSEGDQHPNCD